MWNSENEYKSYRIRYPKNEADLCDACQWIEPLLKKKPKGLKKHNRTFALGNIKVWRYEKKI